MNVLQNQWQVMDEQYDELINVYKNFSAKHQEYKPKYGNLKCNINLNMYWIVLRTINYQNLSKSGHLALNMDHK